MSFDHKKYPVLGYRMGPNLKKHFEGLINQLVKSKNETGRITDRQVTKKEVFVEALSLGLEELINEEVGDDE